MGEQLVQVRRKPLKRKHASAVPFGVGATKPHHYREMARIAWENRGRWLYAWRILTRGVCDGCALGTTGLRDWTLDGVHLCLARLNLLSLNTMDGFDPSVLERVSDLHGMRADALRDLGRIPYPMRRRKGERGFTRVSWDEALGEIGERLRNTDPDRMACYMTSRGITNEVYFAVQKTWRMLGSPHIDNAARLCHSPSTKGMKEVVGVAASTCSYKDWYEADVIVFLGSNPANDQPVALKYLDDAKKKNGTRVLVVNTYEEPGMKRYWIPSTADSALFGSRIADGFYHVTTGGDMAFLHAVQKRLIERDRVDHQFIAEHTAGWDEYTAGLGAFDVDELVRRAGTTREAVESFAEELASAERGIFVWSMGITQHAHGGRTVESICSLALSRGFVGRPGCGLMPIRGHSGVQGGAEMGAYATTFPGGRPVDDAHADELEVLWGFRPPARVGLDATSMVEAAGRGELDVLYQIGGNFRDTLPQPDAIDRALAGVGLRIHQDIVLTKPMLAEPADTVFLLPAKTRYEHEGGVTETTTERRVVLSPHIPGHEVGEAREEWRIAMDIGRAAKPRQADSCLPKDDAEEIRRDIAHTIPKYRDIAHLRKQGDSFQWGGRRLCEGGEFPLEGGKARFVFTEAPDRELPPGQLYLSTRRGKQFNSIVQAEVDHLTGAARDHVLMSPRDMQRIGVVHDEPVVVHNELGRFQGRAFEAPITEGNIQMHWPEANVLIEPGRLDSHGLVPDYNAVVRVEAA